ncbi:hypothetical protein ABW21_db0204963 [Orbilia brochopaga]|nr:hypothetical protein ABW21_db0204963 [Drechslerella brochopaga]
MTSANNRFTNSLSNLESCSCICACMLSLPSPYPLSVHTHATCPTYTMAISQGTLSKVLIVGTMWLLLGTLWLIYIWPDNFPPSTSNGHAPNAAFTQTSDLGGTGAGTDDVQILTEAQYTTRTMTIAPQSTLSTTVGQRSTSIDFAETQPGGGRIVVAAMAKPSHLEIFDAQGRKMYLDREDPEPILRPTGTENRPQKTIPAKARVTVLLLQDGSSKTL